MTETDAAAQPTAREYIAWAMNHADESAMRDGELATHHEEREIVSLFYSVATSLADIAEAMRAERPAPVVARRAAGPWSPPVELPEEFQDGRGETWIRSHSTYPHYRLKRDYRTESYDVAYIRATYGAPSLEVNEGK